MKVSLSVTTTSGAKPGTIVDLPETEARSLIAKGYAKQHHPRRKKKAEATAEAPDSMKEADDGRND